MVYAVMFSQWWNGFLDFPLITTRVSENTVEPILAQAITEGYLISTAIAMLEQRLDFEFAK